ncbi:MAG: LGFP repeat-containing protein [Mycobacterium sp.]
MAAAATAVLAVGCQNAEPIGSATPLSSEVSTSRIAQPAGQFTLQGAILEKFLDTGSASGPLGQPISDEQAGPNGGRYNKFQSGVVYWTAQTGAHIMQGKIRAAWEDTGGAGGPLGYPTTDEIVIAGGSRAEFQHGVITVIDGEPRVEIR